MWDLPGPGLEPVSPALAGGFFTTVPPGKSYNEYLLTNHHVPRIGLNTGEEIVNKTEFQTNFLFPPSWNVYSLGKDNC